MSILLPLYVYPSAGAWDPLYSAAKAHPDVDFNVILNPCSGPCMGSLPDQGYMTEIPKLRKYENIHPLGYVATNYAAKDLSTVLAEIDIYARWPRQFNNSRFSVDGIFFDETPSEYVSYKYDYLRAASQAVRNSTRFKRRTVVHNPGNVSPTLLNNKNYTQTSYMNLSDITVVFEETFDKWIDKATFVPLQSHNIKRSKLAIIVHSLPDVAKKTLDWVVEQVEDAADWVFLTSVKTTDQYYHSFSPLFADFVSAVDES